MPKNHFQWGNKVYEIHLERSETGYRASVDGLPLQVEILDLQPGQLSLLIGSQPVTLYWADDGGQKWVSMDGCTYLLEKPSSRRARRAGDLASAGLLRAPMPAQVRSLEVLEGDPVERGQTLLLLEAMKMEIRIKAPHAGRVDRILVATGQPVDRDQVLVEVSEL